MTGPPVFSAPHLLRLLPALYRVRDIDVARGMPLLTAAEQAELDGLEVVPNPTVAQQIRIAQLRAQRDRGPLAALLAVFAEQLAAVEENLEQLYDDQFIETCADWVVPYIGDLVGVRALHSLAGMPSARAEVAHTITFRRRKGTIAMLEQLAYDVTQWPARAVEFFQLVATTQYMNHLRPANQYSPALGRSEPLTRIGGAFETTAHTIDVRRVRNGRGRYNLPNIGIFLWRIAAHPLTRSPAVRVGPRRWRVSPLGDDIPLYARSVTENDVTHVAEPVNVPEPLARRRMAEHPALYYGVGQSVTLYVDGAPVPLASLTVCDLGDDGATWAHLPEPGVFTIDPERGRVALPPGPEPQSVAVSYHYGFGANIGGGEYERAASFAIPADVVPERVPDDHPDIATAVAALGAAGGVVEITDSGRHLMPNAIDVAANARIEVRARNGRRPTVVLEEPLEITGAAGSELALNGLLMTGDLVRVAAAGGNELARLTLTHLTLVPGWTLEPDGTPADPDEASVVVEADNTLLVINQCITGGIRVAPGARADIADSIIDSCALTNVAYAANDAGDAGGELRLIAVTVVGKVHATVLRLVSNSILAAELAAGDGWTVPVLAQRRQEGCVRFSWVPREARVPRRHRCQPDPDDASGRVAPSFLTLRYGRPHYARLASRTPEEIRRGADDEGEMGAYHALHEPQRETNLRIRLTEYLRAGLEAGVFYES
jgi:hypothetical protein